MRFIVFECRKCGHNLYVENTDDVVKTIGKVSNIDCPYCGEEPERNWLLVGLKNELPSAQEEG
jgi:transcription elongation factor Elf1